MPPRLPMPSTGAALLRSLVRPFSSTSPAAAAEGARDGTHSKRLANLGQNRHGNAHGSGGHGHGHGHGKNGGSYDRVRRGDAATRLLERFKTSSASFIRDKSAQVEFLRNQKISNDYLQQLPRRWQAGDVYSPHDLSPAEMLKWRRRSVRNMDVVDALGISPVDMYKNFSLIQHFTNHMGMISHSSVTRLRPVNQRKIAKMVRRAQGMGIYPSVHAHPEVLRDTFFRRQK